MTTAWSLLDAELDCWVGGGTPATLWWRDDDVRANTLALGRLLGLARRHGLAPGLAAIPALADATLGTVLAEHPQVWLLQHGYAHLDHAAPGEKKIELGGRRPIMVLETELADGGMRLATLYRARTLPVLVPPWNRIAQPLLPQLARLGFRLLSSFGPRRARQAAPGLVQVNTHVDLIDWRGTRGCRSDAALIGDLVAHLRARREARVDPAEPTGILSHHLNHDVACWEFLDTLFERTRAHSGARWIGVTEALR